jgi:pyridoxamine 5'-phosphate oxidase family protein
MTLTAAEVAYLASQQHGRLATVAPDGTPQVKPVGFRYNQEFASIDIAGFNMETSAKFRNVQVNPYVAFVVDDVAGEGAAGVRFLEIRGRAETLAGPKPTPSGLSSEIIRIYPRRVISWNINPDKPGPDARNVAASSETG